MLLLFPPLPFPLPLQLVRRFERGQRASELFLFSFSYSFPHSAISFPCYFIVLVEMRSVRSPRLIEEEEERGGEVGALQLVFRTGCNIRTRG